MKTRLLTLVLVATVAAGAGCRKSPADEPPVATPTLTLAHTRVPLGSPLELTYEFKVASNAPAFTDDLRVFVHFKDANDELMWTDDHVPEVPASRWKPGEVVKYSRLLFVPVYPYVGEASVELGLYTKDGKRLSLSGTDRGQRNYRVSTFQVLPQTENIYLTFKDGWHLAEMAADNAGNQWHWTKKEATLAFRNPKRDALFYLDLDGRTRLLDQPQVVTVRLKDQVIATFPLSEPRVQRIPITAAQFGTDDQVELRLEVDKTFVPAVVAAGSQKDPRELGLRVFHAYIDAR
jgi:hypothetical protein